MQVASELKEYCYSEEEMAAFLGGRRGPLALATLRRRIYTKSNIPPHFKNGDDYWFPRDLYADWLRKRPITWEVKGAS
jgi:hypothetical protein